MNMVILTTCKTAVNDLWTFCCREVNHFVAAARDGDSQEVAKAPQAKSMPTSFSTESRFMPKT
jgi:hypothetical protein